MTQEELFAAIDETIKTNGQKLITAESLAALLKAIAANGGSGGSGQGALRLYALPAMSMDQEFIGQIEIYAPGASDLLKPYVNANAELYASLKTAIDNREEAPLVMLDASSPMLAFMGAVGGSEGAGAIASTPVSLVGSSRTETDGTSTTEFVFLADGNAALAYGMTPGVGFTDGYVLDESGYVTYVEDSQA